jgi:hypothetical protein
MTNHQTWMSVLAAVCLAGCTAGGNVALLEGQLRAQEDRLIALRRQLAEAQTELEAARSEASALRAQLAEKGGAALLPEQADVLFRATGIKFHTYLTTGLDRDGTPGDEQLAVMLVPHDGDGSPLKLAGAIELQALDLAAATEDRELGSWSFAAGECREFWHSGFLSSGYLLELAWKRIPIHPEVTLHARLTTPDGRVFDATEQLRINPPAAAPGSLQAGAQPVTATRTALKPSEPAELPGAEAPLSAPATGVIETSDRFRDRELPRYR